jgi:hypothetical protein
MSMSVISPTGVKAPALYSRRRAWRTSRLLWLVLGAAALFGAEQAISVFETPGQVLRHELQAAGAEMHVALVPQPSPALGQAIRRHFHEDGVLVDMRGGWPNVTVTLVGASGDVCRDAVRAARRIDESVVIQLRDIRTPADCRDRNDMTWWIMP